MKKLLPLLLLMAPPAFAQSVGDCGHLTTARNLPEPWQDNTATYAEGEIRLAVFDTLEPAAAAMHLMILSPPRNELGERQCRVVSLSPPPEPEGWRAGFMSLDFAARQVEYDPARGLVVRMPVAVPNPDTGEPDRGELTIEIDQSTGGITAEVGGT